MTSQAAAEPGISARQLIFDPALGSSMTLLAGAAGLERRITHRRIQKSGLALAGHLHGVVATRVQILGETELSYLEGLSGEQQRQRADRFFEGLSLVVVTRGERPPEAVIAAAAALGTPLVSCEERSSKTIAKLHELLDERLAPRTRIHGVLVDVFEVGVLLLGQSGIGKSECALELVMRGHRLVADDVVECDYRPPGMVFGAANERLSNHMEVRGLGILDIRDLFGVTSIRARKRIDLVIQLALWDPNAAYDRLGVERSAREILGVRVPELMLPVRPGRNMSSIVEIAARSELLRRAGRDPAARFLAQLGEPAPGEPRSVEAAGERAAPANHDLGYSATESAVPPPVGWRPR